MPGKSKALVHHQLHAIRATALIRVSDQLHILGIIRLR